MSALIPCFSNWWSLLKMRRLNWWHISGKLFQFLANFPAPSFTHWNSGWFLPLQLVNLSLCTAASCIFSATLLVPEITLSCRQSEIYNAHAMFGSSMTDVTFWMFSCTVFGMRELWNRSAVTKLEVKQHLRSCKWPGSVAAAVMDFPTMFFLGRVASYPDPLQEMLSTLFCILHCWGSV